MFMYKYCIAYWMCSPGWMYCFIISVFLNIFVSERVKLKRTDYPLVLRIIQGPCEQVCKVFLMEEDLGEEVTYDVNLSINFLFKEKTFLPDTNNDVCVSPCTSNLGICRTSLGGLTVKKFPSTRWRNISSLRCQSFRVSSPSWRRKRTERCRNSEEGSWNFSRIKQACSSNAAQNLEIDYSLIFFQTLVEMIFFCIFSGTITCGV